MRYLGGCAGDDIIARNAAPVALAEFGQAHEEEAVLLLRPRNALPPLLQPHQSLSDGTGLRSPSSADVSAADRMPAGLHSWTKTDHGGVLLC